MAFSQDVGPWDAAALQRHAARRAVRLAARWRTRQGPGGALRAAAAAGAGEATRDSDARPTPAGPATGSCHGSCQPWIIKPQTVVEFGGIPFKYHIVTIWRVPPQLINHGSLIRSWHYHRYEWLDYWHNDGDLGIHHFKNVFVEVCVIREEELLTGCTSTRVGASGNLVSGDFTTQNISIISGTLR